MALAVLDAPPRPASVAARGPRARPALRLGDVALRSAVVVAPMAGITDVPFRQIASEMGAGLVCTEMVAADAVVRSIDASLRLLEFPAGPECPVAVQLVGCDPAVMAEAAQVAVARGAQVVDVNLGCPVRKVVGLGSGAALARDVGRTAAVLEAIVQAVPTPVTAKMRLGWDHRTINAPELARALEAVGVRAVTVHGRTRCQGYAGQADWAEIARVKEAVDIPVLGSGDVVDPRVVETRIRSGCVDGVVLARGMLGDFWLLRQMTGRLAGEGEVAEQAFAERMAQTRRHLLGLLAHYGERRAVKLGRKYVAWAIRGCNGAARLRAAVQGMDSRERLEELLGAALAAGERPEGLYRPVFISGEG